MLTKTVDLGPGEAEFPKRRAAGFTLLSRNFRVGDNTPGTSRISPSMQTSVPRHSCYGPPMGTTTMFDPLIANGAPVLRALGTPPGKFVVE